MATAQQKFATAATTAFQSATLPHVSQIKVFADGIVELTSPDSNAFVFNVIDPTSGDAGATQVTGGNLPWIKVWPGTNYRAYLVFPSSIIPGDKIKVAVDGVDVNFEVPGAADIGSQDWDDTSVTNLIKAAHPPTGPVTPPTGGPVAVNKRALAAKQRALVVYESNPGSNGKMFALDPADATGIPIPAFRSVANVPIAGTLVGEAVLDSSSNQTYVWDGLKWRPIVPPSIVTYNTDTDILIDNVAAPGVYAFSKESGNLFVRYTDGGNDVWRQIGARTYPTEAGLLADAPGDGSVGFAVDTGRIFYRVNSTWEAGSFLTDTEANVLAATPRSGDVAVTTDTGRIYIGDGTAWVGAYVHEYADEATLRAAMPNDGELAVALDTGTAFYRTGGNWLPLNAFSIPSGTSAPLAGTASSGDLFYNTTKKQAMVFNGTTWVNMGSQPPIRFTPPAPTVSDGVKGDLFMDSKGGLYYHTGTAWIGIWENHRNATLAGRVLTIKADGSSDWLDQVKLPVVSHYAAAAATEVYTSKPPEIANNNIKVRKIVMSATFDPNLDTDIWVIGQASGGWINWPNVTTQSHGLSQFVSDGLQFIDWKTAMGWALAGASITCGSSDVNYKAGAGAFGSATVTFTRATSTTTLMKWEVTYLSSNDTPMTSDGVAYLNLNIETINMVGLKASTVTFDQLDVEVEWE